MNRLRVRRKLQILSFPFVLAGLASASPDPRLISLIPHGAQLVAGISASVSRGQPGNLVLLTSENKVDLTDFYALTGGDDTRSIYQVIFVSLPNHRGWLSEHSLLVSGHFDRSRIYKSATEVGATLSDYRGIEVAEIQPFGREEERFKEVRWLAVLDSSVLVFGSVSLTRLELDRFLGRAHADESIVRRLGRLRSKDQTWCVLSGSIRSLSSPVWTEEIRKSLADVSPELATKALSADEFEFGLFYGRKVEFEYFLSRASTEPDKSNADPSKQSSLQPVRSTALLPALNTTGPANALHDVIAIPVPRFEEWLAKISTSSH